MQHDNPFIKRAQLLLAQRRYDLAEEQARQAIGADPNEAIAYAYLGICLAEREAWQEATQAAEQAIGLDPTEAYAHYVYARVLMDRNMPKEAREAIGQTLELSPEDADYWGVLASIELSQRRWIDAKEAAERGLESDPEHEMCLNIRAVALTNLGDREAAGVSIDASLSRNPENPVTHANLGWTRLHERRPREAMEHFREALRLDPDNEWARAGIVEAMKARNFIYRVFLSYFLFMNRLSSRSQWLILVGGYVGVRLLSSASQSNPKLAPFFWPLIVAYMVFALGTVVSVPLFNLLLFTSRFGRHALNRSQRVGAIVFGASLLPAILFLIMWAIAPTPAPFLGSASLVAGAWIIPVALATLVRRGVPSMVMAALAAVLGLVGGVLCCFLLYASDKAPFMDAAFGFAVLCMLTTWVANISSVFRPRVKK